MATPLESVQQISTVSTVWMTFLQGGPTETVDLGDGGPQIPTLRKLVADFPTENEQVAAIQAALDQVLAAIGVQPVQFDTKADLDAHLGYDVGKFALVTADLVAANNGLYDKKGGIGGGYWHKSIDRVDAESATRATLVASDVQRWFYGYQASQLYGFETATKRAAGALAKGNIWVWPKLVTAGAAWTDVRPRWFLGRPAIDLKTDKNGHAMLGHDARDGAPLFQRMNYLPQVGGRDENSTCEFFSGKVDSKRQIFRQTFATGAIVQMTFKGENTDPKITHDGAYITYWSNRDGEDVEYVQAVGGDGSVEFRDRPKRKLICIGDSMFGAGIVTMPGYLKRVLNIDTVVSAFGGQTTFQALGRFLPTTVNVAGAQIVSGSNTITAINGQAIGIVFGNSQFLSDASANTYKQAGTLSIVDAAGRPVHGNVVRTANASPPTVEQYFFVADSNITLPVSCPNGTTFTPDTQDYADCMFAICLARNEVTYNKAQSLANIAQLIGFFSARYKAGVIHGVCNGTDEPAGSGAYNWIVDFNATLAATYPNFYASVREAWVASYDLSIPTDVTAHNEDRPPPSKMADLIHPTDPGCKVMAGVSATIIRTKGWLSL